MNLQQKKRKRVLVLFVGILICGDEFATKKRVLVLFVGILIWGDEFATKKESIGAVCRKGWSRSRGFPSLARFHRVGGGSQILVATLRICLATNTNYTKYNDIFLILTQIQANANTDTNTGCKSFGKAAAMTQTSASYRLAAFLDESQRRTQHTQQWTKLPTLA